MSIGEVTAAQDERIVELASSGVSQADDGDVEAWLHIEATGTSEPAVGVTEDDALALIDALRQPAHLVTGRELLRFTRLLIHEPD